MPSSSFTFNSNNNYQVDRVNEPDVDNPSVFKYTSTSSTPFVEIKITPTNPQTNPVLASNLKFDDLIPYFQWAGVGQSPQTCAPSPTPHGAISSIQHTNMLVVPNTCINGPLGFGFSNSFGSSNEAWQGPYHVINDPTAKAAQIQSLGVAWKEVVLIEVYEDDLGYLINDNHSPAIDENYNHWAMWSGPVSTPGGLRREITTNVYPKYVKAFVYLEFGTSGLFSNTILNIDIDEVEPTYGCTNPIATNYNSNAQIDDNSCVLPPSDYGINISVTAVNNGPVGVSAGPYTSGQVLTDLNGNSFTTSVFASPTNMQSPGTVTLANRYSPGDHVNEVVQFFIYPTSTVDGFGNTFSFIYDYPLSGGPNPNISQTNGYQQNPGGWGDAKNNLTAASVMLQDPDSLAWNSANYQTFNNYSYWHNGIDPTGLQPSFTVGYDNFSFTSAILISESYSTSSPFSAQQYFPEFLVLDIMLDFYLQGGNNLPINGEIDLNINIFHNTENQGDFNWTAPVSGCTDPLANNYDPNATIDDGSCAYVNPI